MNAYYLKGRRALLTPGRHSAAMRHMITNTEALLMQHRLAAAPCKELVDNCFLCEDAVRLQAPGWGLVCAE